MEHCVSATQWCGLQGFGGNTGLSAQQCGGTQLEAKHCGVSAPLNEGWAINLGKTFVSAKTAEKPQLEQMGRPQDARKEEETSLCEFWHLQCQLLSLFSLL